MELECGQKTVAFGDDPERNAVKNALPDDGSGLAHTDDWEGTGDVEDLRSKEVSAAIALTRGADDVCVFDISLFEAAEKNERLVLNETTELSMSGD